jgi:dihydroxyacetone kinase
MKKLINGADRVVEEMVEGLVATHPGLRRLAGRWVIVGADRREPKDRRVAPISGGGSGHEPAHAGYVGAGMLAAAVAGDVFTSPSPDAVLAAIRAVSGPAGAVLIVKNYTGDRLNFGLAAEFARSEGTPVELVIVADDAALAGSTGLAGARGLAGTVLVHKVAGAATMAGGSLAEVAAEARAAAGALATMGVALSPCTVPAAGKPGFTLGDDEIELGLGIHGEPGVRKAAIGPADAIVDTLLATILDRLAPKAGDRVALLVNNLGGTTTMELAIVARRAIAGLDAAGLVVERVYSGTFLSALEMAGVSISVLLVDDARLARLDAPTDAPAWPNAANKPRSRETTVPDPSSASTAPDSPPPGPAVTPIGRAIESALRAATSALIAATDRLTTLDQAVGDGDLGLSLARGSRAVLDALSTYHLDDPPAALRSLGQTLQAALGGTSGPLYAMFVLAAADRLKSSKVDDPLAWADAFAAGCARIGEVGGASPGDRTMLDALVPASEAFSSAIRSGQPPAAALALAATAAERGAEATSNLTPRRGRSSYLGARALGHPDPGAVAVGIWLRAIAGALPG